MNAPGNNQPFTDRLYQSAAPIWKKCMEHPFVKGIGDGSLPLEKFRYFMLQDYVYLYDYARVFALGTVKAKDPALMREFARNVDEVLHGEMEIHRAYMRRLGITPGEAERAEMAYANAAYTDYMLRIAWERGPAEIAASILACAVSYEDIALRIVSERPEAADHPFYGEWIRGYADPGYGEANRALEALTDRLAAGTSMERLREIMRICSLHELAFWDMAWEMRP